MSRIYLFVLGILSLGIIFSVGSEAAPSTGTVQVAFILSEFEDQEYQDGHDQDYFEDLAFGETDSMWEYFDEVSRSVLNIDGDVFGPYTLDGDAADYGPENQNFVRDSVEIADDDIDYRDYDAVMVIHSGPGEESSGNSDDIWSIHWTTNIETEDNGYEIKRITQAPEYQNSNGERSPLGVWVHEFGHELGLPDLYDTDGSSEGIGHWGVMASGSWTDNGETPAYFSAWCRYWLGWISPIPMTDDVNNLVLEPIEDGGDVYLLSIPGNWSGSEEYFLIENRQKMKYDQYLPGEGLLIWHIDDRESNNRDEDHKLVDLEEADGNDDLDHNTNRGDDGDPYTSGSFTKDTYPNSLAYNGTESGWKIENIEVDGSNIIVDISFLSKPHAIADADEAVIAEGFELQFYGDESWDEDGNIVNYTWDFGDGTTMTGESVTHSWAEGGLYFVVLTAKDAEDRQSVAFEQVSIDHFVEGDGSVSGGSDDTVPATVNPYIESVNIYINITGDSGFAFIQSDVTVTINSPSGNVFEEDYLLNNGQTQSINFETSEGEMVGEWEIILESNDPASDFTYNYDWYSYYLSE